MDEVLSQMMLDQHERDNEVVPCVEYMIVSHNL